ncbi:alpha/beta fold hydrolase [Cereibacter sphaeroides]|jgi:pimeloyl-ACP methyl ester carboxylesterase|uniref:alpha/beta fold hydrolase n=1 Tax=Cereibacter sphaeroides TaxID=1063 RepID=UPI000A311F37
MTLSPDGATIAWLNGDAGVSRVVVATAAPVSTRVVQRVLSPTRPGVTPVLVWAGSRHLLVFRDAGGDENYRAFAVDAATGAERPLTPPGARALIRRCTPDGMVMFWMNDRDAACFDLVQVDVVTGSAQRVFTNTHAFSMVHLDSALRPVLAEAVQADGARVLMRSDGDTWPEVARIAPEDALGFRVVGVTDRAAHLVDSTGRDTAALVMLDVRSGARTVLAADTQADIDAVVLSPSGGAPLAAGAMLHRRRWQAVDPAFAPVLAALARHAGVGQFDIVDVSSDSARVLARIEQADRPVAHVMVDGGAVHRIVMRAGTDGLTEAGLRPMEPVTLAARDGLPLHGYVTRPKAGHGPAPLVLLVHGGPYDRDRWGFSPTHQWLASRGFAVLSVNFRGSTGFGKAFIAAGDREWGGRMQDDLADAVGWAVAQGIADPARVQVMGSSYGGYAALMTAGLHPDLCAGVVSIGGPSSLAGFMDAIPPYWQSWFAMIRQRLADPAIAEGRAWLDARSPLAHVATIHCPVLMIHGRQDVRVPLVQARAMAAALAAAGRPVTLAVLPDEGHFISGQANRVALAALVEAFLQDQAGGPVEDVAEDLVASRMAILQGGDFLPGAVLARLRARNASPA